MVLPTFDLDEYVHGALGAGAREFLLRACLPYVRSQVMIAKMVTAAR